jgi:hypothetical protein
MQFKTIKSVLKRKINHWVDHVEDDRIKKIIKENAIVCGGSITSLLMNERVNDFDIYLKTVDAAKEVSCYYVALFKKNPPPKFKDKLTEIDIGVIPSHDRVKIVVKSAGIASEDGPTDYQYFEMLPPEESGEAAFEYVNKIMETLGKVKTDEGDEKPKYRPVFITTNAITLSDDIQIVVRFVGNIDKIHENYDFTHCKCGYDYATNELYVPQDAMESMMNKELKYTTSRYPLCSIIRMRKFIKRGWHINAGQIVKIAWDLHLLNLADVSVLEDQMVGVDTAYFHEVIRLLKEQQSGEEKRTVDGAYLMQIIDKVFG